MELESNDDDKTPVLTFKNKDKKRYKEIEAKMDLLIESQRQLWGFSKKKRKEKESGDRKPVEEKKIWQSM